MRYIIYTAVMFVLLMALKASSHAQAPLGDWEGTAQIGPQSLKLVFHLTEKDGKLMATMDSPDQGAYGIPMDKATFKAPKLTLAISQMMFSFEGEVKPESGKIEGTVTQMGQSFPVVLTSGAKGPDRPQTPKAPFPYEVREVSFENPIDDIKLAGTLTIPQGKGPFPTVVLISGSGPQDRDETIMEHKPFWVIADAFSRKGIAVLRFDERGVGESEGDFASATTKDFARDVQSAIEFLKQQPEVNAFKIGLIGHSEGGLVAPMVASYETGVSYIITLGGPTLPGYDIILMQLEAMLLKSGVSQELTDKNVKVQEALLKTVMSDPDNESVKKKVKAQLPEILAAFSSTEKAMLGISETNIMQQLPRLTSDWYRMYLKEDPIDHFRQVDVPILALYGGKDLQVPASQNLSALEGLMENNPDFKGKVYPNLNHLFQTAETGLIQEYGKITETFSEEVIGDMIEWIKGQ